MLPRHETTLRWPIYKSELHAIFNGHDKLVNLYTPDIVARRTRTPTAPGGRTMERKELCQNGGIKFV
jgi:hypothetical protein